MVIDFCCILQSIMIRMHFSTFVIFLLSIYISNTGVLKANAPYYYFKQIGISEGLSQSKVQSVISDYKGFLWIGTESGLNRYDGNNVKQYFSNKDDISSLPDNNIIFLEEDSLNNLWIGTKIGICVYDRLDDSFTTLTNNNSPIYIASALKVEGGVLFNGPGVIYKYIYENEEFVNLHNSKEYTTFMDMVRYDEETVLLNSRWRGIHSMNILNYEIQKVEYFKGVNYTSIYVDSKRRQWVGLYGEGLFCYENGVIIKHFNTSNSPLTYNVIHDITEKDNHLWLATDGGGINIISLEDYSFSYIQANNKDGVDIPLSTTFRLYLDSSNNMWAGTIRNGLIGIKNVFARSYTNVPFGYEYGLSNNTVNTIFEDQNDFIWVGTDGGGVNRYDPTNNTFIHFPFTKEDKVVAIEEYSINELIYSSFNKGVFILNKHTGATRPFILIDENANDKICKSGYSVYLKKISENEIIFSAEQLIVYNVLTNKFKIVAEMGVDYERNSPSIISTKGDLTYLADLKNICVYNSANDSFSKYYLDNDLIFSASIDDNGVFWIASEAGLKSFNPSTGSSNIIETNVFDEAISAISDTRGRIWVGTRRNLYTYSPVFHSFITLDEVDGVQPNEYIPNSYLVSANGNIFLGGTNGLTIINSNIEFQADTGYSIEILEVLLNGSPTQIKESNKRMSLNTESTYNLIKVPWYFTSLELSVLLNEDDILRKNLFRFKLNGENYDLMKTSSSQINISHLPTGEYFLTASYYTQTGSWSKEQELLKIIISPPWWKTKFFNIALTLIVLLVAVAIMRFITLRNRDKQRQEIALLKSKMNEEKVNLLTNISHELRTPLTLVYAPLKRIIEGKYESGSLNEQLNQIYSSSHQMMNILNLVLNVRKLEEGKDILNIKSHDINEWIYQIGNKFKLEFESNGIRINYDLDSSIERVDFDELKCEFVLSNFLINALKFRDKGTTVIVKSECINNGSEVRVSVIDQGIGLNTTDIESLFSNYYQGEHNKGGSGIGLSYSKSIINLHKGKIGARNAQEKGSIFYFEIPVKSKLNIHELVNEKLDSSFEIELIKDSDYSNLKNLSIVIVEDTTDLREYLKDTLNIYFKHVYTAKNGLIGLELIKSELPDIILSDVMMPKMNGFELCQEVKSNIDISHIPFILLTAYNDPQKLNTGYKTGADAFLSKPFDIDTLLSLIHNQIKFRENIRNRYQIETGVSHKDISFSNADETFLIRFNELIEKNISNTKLDVSLLATNMFMSRSLLFNKVKAITGIGIVEYINKQRVEKSTMLLTTTTLTISEISDMVGFSSSRYFSRVFKSEMGVSPSDYRK